VFASTYHAPGPMGYGRYGNPTWTAFEEALGALEGGVATSFASGMAAVSATLSLLPEGACVVGPSHAYLGTVELLRERERQGRIELRVVDVADSQAVAAAAKGADLVWLESPTNPMLQVADIAAAASAAHDSGGLLVVDNTFATPLLQRPLALGADIVVHSVTKYLAGHADVVLGAVVAVNQDLTDRVVAHRSTHGSIPGPMETFLALRGMRTLHLRVERSQATAVTLVNRLRSHPAVSRVRYAGLGSIVSIELSGGAPAADLVATATRLWVHATSLGGVESSLERRRRWPTEIEAVPESLVRLSVGIEDVEDLWHDLANALDAATATTGG
jgi:cystathionine gamma-synthase